MLQFNAIHRLNTFRLRLPNMYATIIAAKGDHTTVCESRISTNVTYTADCRGVNFYRSYIFLIFLLSLNKKKY